MHSRQSSSHHNNACTVASATVPLPLSSALTGRYATQRRQHCALLLLLQALFPARSQHHQQELASWLAAACGVPTATSSSGTSSSSSSGASKPESQVTANTLAALVHALQQELSCWFSGISSSSSPAAGSEPAGTAAAPDPGVHTAAVKQLTDGLLRQHLTLALQHSKEVGQQLQQLLQGAPAGSPSEGAGMSGAAAGAGVMPAADDPVWQQVAQYLQGQGLQAASSSTSVSAAGDSSCADTLVQVLSCEHAARNAADSSHASAGACSVVGMLQRSCLFVPPACRADPRGAVMVCAQLSG